MHQVSSLLPEGCLPTGQHPSGDELSSSNWELHCENSLATGLNLVRHIGTRACLYFAPEMEHWNVTAVNYSVHLLQMVSAN